jgi:CHAT domain-containing protein
MNFSYIINRPILTIISLLFILAYLFTGSPTHAQINSEDTQIEQLARERYWQGDFLKAIKLWQALLPSLSLEDRAEVQSYIAVAYRQSGQPQLSISHFRESLNLYTKLKKTDNISIIKIELANLYNEIAHPNQAIAIATEALELTIPESQFNKALALKAIATGFFLKGELNTAIETYQQAQMLIPKTSPVSVDINNDLGVALLKRKDFLISQANLAKEEGFEEENIRLQALAQQDEDRTKALFFSNEEIIATHNLTTLATTQTYLNIFKLSGDRHYLTQAETSLNLIPSSRSKSEILIQISQYQQEPLLFLAAAETASQSLGDYRTQSLALGEMGAYYEETKRFDLALKFTEKAKLLAQTGRNEDILYLWLWQSGRIYRYLGQLEKARISYLGAISTLESLRFQIATANPDLQLNFLEDVQPIYRELLSLMLTEGNSLSQEEIKEVLKVRNQLELSELQAFFGDSYSELQQTKTSNQPKLQPKTAKIYFILLNDNSYQILELPDGSLKLFTLGISKKELEEKLLEWRQMLLTSRIPKGYEPLSRELYDLLLISAVRTLPSDTQQLIFVGDGLLRNVPLAALMDKDQFLIEKYAVGYSLSLPIPKKEGGKFNNYLAFGLSVKTDYFPALPFVKNEIESLSHILRGKSFVDETFTEKNFQEQIQKKYPIIHIATHAVFSGSAQETFIQAFDSVISLNELEILLRKSGNIYILFLSACKTAVGNERSVLGLGGVGARAGVSNVIASLWSVRDQTTSDLVSEFYTTLVESDSAIESLRQVQLKLLHLHPKVWVSFILISNHKS